MNTRVYFSFDENVLSPRAARFLKIARKLDFGADSFTVPSCLIDNLWDNILDGNEALEALADAFFAFCDNSPKGA